jgi:regulatory protein
MSINAAGTPIEASDPEAEHAEGEVTAGLSGTLTALEVQARDPERVNLYLDGRFAFGLNAKTATEAGLKRGDFLSVAQITALLKDEAFERAMLQAFNQLSFRGRSAAELRRVLKTKGHAPETIEAVLSRLTALHYVDDETFALSWVENRQRSRPRGPHLLRSELAQKGVARETVDQAIEDAALDETSLVLDAARKKAQTLHDDDYAAFSRKLGGYLSRRGFSSNVVWDAVKTAWRERGEGSDAVDDIIEDAASDSDE